MEIKLHSNLDSVARVSTTQSKASRPIDADSKDVSVFDNSRALEARLKNLPDVRAEKVANAQRLVADPAYPPRETIQRIAQLLAINSSAASGHAQGGDNSDSAQR